MMDVQDEANKIKRGVIGLLAEFAVGIDIRFTQVRKLS